MMMKPVSEALMDLLVRQGIANGRAGTRAGRGKTNASSPKALSVYEWANALIDREEMIEAGHSPAGGEEYRRMRIPVAGGTKPPAVGGSVKPHEPSPARSRPVLRVINGKCEPTRSKASKATLGVGSHLTLVWSR